MTLPRDHAGVLILFVYAFLSNVAMAVVPHEPAVIWYGRTSGVLLTAVVATAGTVAASWVDYRLFAAWISRIAASKHSPSWLGKARVAFARAPFFTIALSGLTPLPFFPFKVLAFAERYPLACYLSAVALGRFPRYVLLAWLGYTLAIPGWPFVLLSLLFFLPTLRRFLWPRPNVS